MSGDSRLPRVLLVDFDGVIRHWPPHQRDIEHRHGLPEGALHAAAFAPDLLGEVTTGHIDDGAWRARVRQVLSREIGDDAAGRAVQEWSASAGTVDAEVLAVLERADVGVVLATNATSRLSEDLERLGLTGQFLRVVNSSDVGAAKPDEAFFTAALAIAAVQPSEAMFVDDSKENVLAAAALGIRSLHFTGADALRRFLRRDTGVAEARTM